VIQQLLLALLLTGVTVIMHAVGTVRVVLPMAGVWNRKLGRSWTRGPVITLTRLVSGLLFLHLSEMAIWAVAFTAVGIFSDFETSL
jgi:hypothetical protein